MELKRFFPNHAVDSVYSFDESDNDSDTPDTAASKDGDIDSTSESDDDDDYGYTQRNKKKSKAKKKSQWKKKYKEDSKLTKIKQEPGLHELLLKMNSTQDKAIGAVESVMNQVQTLSQTVAQTRPLYNANAPSGSGTGVANDLNRQPRFQGCSFCGSTDGHYMRACLTMQEYLHQGLIRKDEVMGRLTLKTGEGIPNNPPNSPLKVRVDAYIKGLVDMYRTSTGANKPQSENQKMPAMLIQTHKCEDYDRAMNGRGLAIWTDDEQTDDELRNLVSSLETQRRVSPRKKQINEADGPLTEKPNKLDFVPKKILPRPKAVNPNPIRKELVEIPDLEGTKKLIEEATPEISENETKIRTKQPQDSRPSMADPAPRFDKR